MIFDLDGTLLNTLDDIGSATNTVLKRHNLAEYPLAEYRYFIGKGIYRLVYQVLPEELRTEETLQKIFQEVLDEYAKNLDIHTKPFAGIPELLDELTYRHIRMAILSNKAHELMDEVVNNHFAKWDFEVVFGARKNVPTKPNPQSAFEILEIMQLNAEEVVYIGDTDVDMQTANNAGFYAVGASWGFRTPEELKSNGAKLIIEKPQDLIELFN